MTEMNSVNSESTSVTDQPERSKLARSTVKWLVILIAVHSALVVWNDVWNSPVIDEVGHLPAGIRIWETGQFDLYRVNPPLVKLVAAIPAVVFGAEQNWSQYADSPRERTEWVVGKDFIWANGQTAFWYFTAGRICCLPFSWLGAIVCFTWAREWYGDRAGLLAAFLWCASPNVLTWAATITPDLAATSFGLLAAWRFWRWLDHPNWNTAGLAGLALGLAELTKFTWIILFAIWPVIWLAFLFIRRREFSERSDEVPPGKSASISQLLVILGLGLYILNLGYGFEGTGKQAGDFVFVSQTLTGGERGEWGNRFAGTLLGEVPAPFPENYVRGIDLQKVDFERGMDSYLLGEWRTPGGWWYYYIVCAVVKIPAGIWLLILVRVGMLLRPPSSDRPSCRTRYLMFLPSAAVFLLVSSQTGFSRYFRYVLPCLPFLFIWVSAVFNQSSQKTLFTQKLGWLAIAWCVLSLASVYPYTLSYFNEFAGGPKNGSAVLLDSNIDWGQDLHRVKAWDTHRSDGERLFVMHTGFCTPEMAGIACEWPQGAIASEQLSHLSVKEKQKVGPQPGWYILSVHELMRRHAEYEFFDDFTPVGRIGYSMLIYHLDSKQIADIREELGLALEEPAGHGGPAVDVK